MANEDFSRTIRMNICLIIGKVLCMKDSLEMKEMGIGKLYGCDGFGTYGSDSFEIFSLDGVCFLGSAR